MSIFYYFLFFDHFLGEEQVTISKQEYDAFNNEYNSQELLIAGFQKENEKLIFSLQTRDRENVASKAKFFDQQEYLNKELNRLRNMVGEIPIGKEKEYLNNLENFESDLTNIKISLGTMGGNVKEVGTGTGTGTGVRGMGVTGFYLNKSADEFRAELDKDAFVRHLRERAAIAESGAGVREKELQQVLYVLSVLS